MLFYMFNLLLCILIVQVVWIRFVQQLNLDGDSVKVTRSWQLKHAWPPSIIAEIKSICIVCIYDCTVQSHWIIAFDNRL